MTLYIFAIKFLSKYHKGNEYEKSLSDDYFSACFM